jgi:hypothetical protein
MKSFCYIFSIYIFLLAIVPCGDIVECNNLETNIIAGAVNDFSHQDHEHSEEKCTPFCHCACCGIHILATDLVFFEYNKFQPKFPTIKVSYITSFYPEIYFNIWQPPKLIC